MLKTIGPSIVSASRVDNDEIVGGGGVVGQSDASKTSAKSKSWIKSGYNLGEPKFLTSKAKEAFNHLK